MRKSGKRTVFKNKKHGVLINTWSKNTFEGIVVNRELQSLNGGSLKITLTVPLTGHKTHTWLGYMLICKYASVFSNYQHGTVYCPPGTPYSSIWKIRKICKTVVWVDIYTSHCRIFFRGGSADWAISFIVSASTSSDLIAKEIFNET